jgi:protein SCO1
MNSDPSRNEPPIRPSNPVPVNKTLKWILWSALVVVICSLGVSLVFQQWRQTVGRREKVTLDHFNTVPPFEFTSQDGKAFKSERLAGKIWVADFFFTDCPGPCLRMSAAMEELQEAVRKKTDVDLVSFSINPSADTPPVLEAYAQKFQAAEGRWFFLTGDRAAIYDLASKTFLLGVTDAKTGDEKMEQGQFIHSTKLVLVDRKGQIRGYYDTNRREMLTQLLTDIGALMREQPRGE